MLPGSRQEVIMARFNNNKKKLHMLEAQDVQNSPYLSKLSSLIGVDRFLRRCKIYFAIWGGKVPERTKVLAEIKRRVREMEANHGKVQ